MINLQPVEFYYAGGRCVRFLLVLKIYKDDFYIFFKSRKDFENHRGGQYLKDWKG